MDGLNLYQIIPGLAEAVEDYCTAGYSTVSAYEKYAEAVEEAFSEEEEASCVLLG